MSHPADRLEPESAPPWWELLGAGVILALLTGAVIGPVFAPTQAETPILRLIWLPVYAWTVVMVGLRIKKIGSAWPALIALLMLVGLTFISKYWSIDPSTTSRRVLAMAMSGTFAVYIGAVFRGPHLPRLLMHTGLVLGVGSLLFVFLLPRIGVHQDVNAGLWRGLWYEKNQMGIVMTACAVASAAVLASDLRRWLIPLGTVGLSSLLVLGTQSKTSLLCLMLGLGLVGALWAMRKGGPVLTIVGAWLAVVGGGGGVWLWNTQSAAILEALGKDPTLTGRTHIWASLMRRVAERPWTGYGYNAFWGKESIPAMYVRRETGWAVPSAHNGWIDLLVQLGWPGAVLVGSLMLIAALVTLWRLDGAGAREGGWGFAYLCVFFMLSLSESVLMSHQSLPWTLVLAIFTRAMLPAPLPARAPLARRGRQAYVAGSRIASSYAHGRPVLL
ncbi:polymerase [Brevundimonas sp. Leaf363]|uniref:O-antigen ligase family protein n=1 Tax=Brevundimonas sp. Leaf363 TaxID=1736353 RepID=UPI0006F2C4A5|nr:O-antigen ligase family protein [Brevundimonas sp. Leaf363]KQS56320.1 polymerase [Brevundimonas sp. Leaf363]